MKRLIALLVLAAVALAPGVAQAKSRAKVYRGTFQAVGADGDYVTGRFGHAHLVDTRNRDKLSVHVRRLAPRSKYVFRLLQAPEGTEACEEGAPGGTEVPRWRYRNRGVLETNRRGVANGSARSHRFRAQRDVEYFVGVYSMTAAGAPDDLLLCAALERRGAKGHGKARDDDKDKTRGRADSRDDDDKARGRSESDGDKDKSRGRAEGQDDDKARGRSDEAPRGRAEGHEDKPRGGPRDGEERPGNGRGNGNGREKGRG